MSFHVSFVARSVHAAVALLAISLSALVFSVLTGPAFAGTVSSPMKSAVHHKRHHASVSAHRPSAAALAAFAATTVPAKPLTVPQVETNPIALLQKFSVDDLNAALADAQAQSPPDQTAIQCYTALIPIVQSNVANPLPTGAGMFQLAQKVRDFKALTANLQSPTGPLATLNQACAAWVLDGVNTFLALGTQLGLIAATGGAAGALPFALPFPIKLP
jgi:hypothetical protein